MEIVFASSNKNKIAEIQALLPEGIHLLGLPEIGCTEEIPETMPTIEGNALQKARYVKEKYGRDCFADDTGLEVQALGGQPGVLSARYAGEQKNAEDNMQLLLKEMKIQKNRKARFRTVISLVHNNQQINFEGIVDGQILTEKRGAQGFGYDPVFVADGYSLTFAEMDMEEKNKISHRAIAVRKLIEYLHRLPLYS
jgi:XTP/dITP diphosphohydrolase